MPNILIFGAGNIGRAFIGQLFSEHDYAITFVDIDEELIEKLHMRNSYPVAIRQTGKDDVTRIVAPVDAVSAVHTEAVIQAMCVADVLATSVGKNALPSVAMTIAAGLVERMRRSCGPIDLILAENIHNGREFLYEELGKHLPDGFPLSDTLGIVETSIGKMVPIITDEDRGIDPLLVAAEPYHELILDAEGFITPLPREFSDIHKVSPIEAYVDRKLYIHNLGHAAAAYIGNLHYPDAEYIYEVVAHTEIMDAVRSAMEQSAAGIMCKYPGIFSREGIAEHIEDLLYRFTNEALRDTVFRVGRDLRRKLHRSDRVIGAIRNCEKFHLPWGALNDVVQAACSFQPEGHLSVDSDFQELMLQGEDRFIELCQLDREDPVDQRVIRKLTIRKDSTYEG